MASSLIVQNHKLELMAHGNMVKSLPKKWHFRSKETKPPVRINWSSILESSNQLIKATSLYNRWRTCFMDWIIIVSNRAIKPIPLVVVFGYGDPLELENHATFERSMTTCILSLLINGGITTMVKLMCSSMILTPLVAVWNIILRFGPTAIGSVLKQKGHSASRIMRDSLWHQIIELIKSGLTTLKMSYVLLCSVDLYRYKFIQLIGKTSNS